VTYRALRFFSRLSFSALHCAALVGLVATPAAAQQRGERPPPAKDLTFEPIEDNPFFTQDPNDPRVLLKKDTFNDVGFTRAYVERMARPALPAAALDAIEDANITAGVDGAVDVTVSPLALPGAATVFAGNIMVIEGDARFTAETQNGLGYNHNSGIQYVLNEVFTRAGDLYDFITVFTTFDDPNVAAYYMPLRQHTSGLGECNFNTGETFGCIFDSFSNDGQSDSGVRLQGFVFMNSLGYWRNWDYQMDGRVHALTSVDHSLYPVMGQEVAHRWGSGLRFKDPRTGAISKKLLGRDNSHWAGWVDSDASVMDGVDWVAQDDGSFLAVDDMFRFSTLDLYTIGALPPQAARPFFFVDNARFVPNQFVGNQAVPAELTTYLPSIEYLSERGVDLEMTGDRVDLTIQDIMDAEGVRCPDPDHTQKSFKQLFVLITAPGESAAQAAGTTADLETVKTVWEDWWLQNTERRMSICAHPDEYECPLGEQKLGGWSIEDDNGDGYVDPGESFELVVDVESVGDANLENVRVLAELSGGGADEASLDETTFTVGDIDANGESEVRIPVSTTDGYGCGTSLKVQLTLTSDNAADVIESYRVFPGYQVLSETTFDDDANDMEFFVDDENTDNTERGALSKEEVLLSCYMTPNTPERDATPDGTSAFVTGDTQDLAGNTTLYSNSFALEGTALPEIRFSYWLEGNGQLDIAVSSDASTYTAYKTYDEGYHGWVLGRVDLTEAFGEELPEKAWVRFEFSGDGVEGGIDDIRFLDAVGMCAPPPAEFLDCNCDASSSNALPAGFFAFTLLFGLLRRRRQRRA